MIFDIKQNDIVSTGDGEHKMVLSVNGNTAKLCYYTTEGKQYDFIALKNCKFVSHVKTKRFAEMEALFLKGHSSFLENEQRKRAHRISLAKSIDHRKTVRTHYP